MRSKIVVFDNNISTLIIEKHKNIDGEIYLTLRILDKKNSIFTEHFLSANEVKRLNTFLRGDDE